MLRKLIGFLVPVVVLATLIPLSGAYATSGQSGDPANYSIVKVAPKNGGEPSIATDPVNANRVYVSWPGGGMSFYRSTDSGATWTAGAKADTQSGDTSVNVDPTGAIYQSNLNGISNNPNTLQGVVFKSKDQGSTWTRGSGFLNAANSTNNPLLVDRQWTDTYIEPNDDGSLDTDKGLVYITYHDWGPDTIWVNVSKDGGKTFGAPVAVPSSPPADPDAAAASAQASAASFCDTIPGGVKVVPADAPASKHPGRAYIAWLAGDLATNPSTGCNYTQLNTFHTIWIAWSDDQGAHWTPHLVYDAGPMHDASALFADITVDSEGNPYVAYGMNLYSAGTTDMFVNASFDGGTTWNGKSDGSGQPYTVNVTDGTDAT
ncbi:MAG TPA: sialidase family protein, partial [Actinomycetota bacterium]